MEKGLNKRERGRLRFEKLKEAEANGKLQKAKTRMEVAQLAGFSEHQYKTGYSWVMNMLTRKHLIEHISGRFPNGRAEYEYHIGTEPDYNLVGATKGRAKARTKQKVEQTTAGRCHTWTDEASTLLNNAMRVIIKYGETTIELEQVESSTAINLVVEVLNKLTKGA